MERLIRFAIFNNSVFRTMIQECTQVQINANITKEDPTKWLKEVVKNTMTKLMYPVDCSNSPRHYWPQYDYDSLTPSDAMNAWSIFTNTTECGASAYFCFVLFLLSKVYA